MLKWVSSFPSSTTAKESDDGWATSTAGQHVRLDQDNRTWSTEQRDY
ncbi:hypothetical protein [Cryobacterium sp. M15]|nr:hypothetical protein [Cryobacterium sp. M15]